MKFNICGFDQSVLVELNEQHKEIGQQLDCTDLIILQWIADFFSRNSVKKVFIDGNLYAWVVYNNIVEDLPFISVNKRTFADRLDKLKAFGLIEKRVEKQKGYGTYLYIRMTSSYEELHLLSASGHFHDLCRRPIHFLFLLQKREQQVR